MRLVSIVVVCLTSFVAHAQDLSPGAVARAYKPDDQPAAADQPDADEDGIAESENEDDAAARRAFQAGREAFDGGDYEAALHQFERAYSLSARPELLYNIGQSADRLRRDELAIEAFEAYLAEARNPPNADAVRARIQVLRSQAAEPPERNRAPLIGGIIGAVVGVAAIALVLGFTLRDDGAPQHDLRIEALTAR